MNSQLSHFSTLGNGHVLVGFVSCSTSVFYHVYDVESLNDLPENDMLMVQEWCRSSCDEELASVGVRSRILIIPSASSQPLRHTQEAGSIVTEIEIFICELGGTVDGGTPSTVAIDEIAALDHEPFDLYDIVRDSVADILWMSWSRIKSLTTR